MKELIVNAGSSSLKYTVYQMPEKKVLCAGIFEQLTTEFPTFTHKLPGENGKLSKVIDAKDIEPFSDHKKAISILMDTLVSADFGVISDMSEIKAVGHRIVHGGETFDKSVIVDENVLEEIRKLIPLAPLHNPANIIGIEACEQVIPNAKQVVVFDTAFHQTIAPEAYMYALPYGYYKKYGVRRYGFHGTSHKFVSQRAAEFLEEKYPGKYNKETLRVITCHLGNGSSISAVKGGKCVDTTMGLTPLEGIMMGTRCGSIDPAIVPFLMKAENLSADEIDTVMNKKSGMLGLTEDDPNNAATSDNRTIESRAKAGDERAMLVEAMFVHQLTKLVGGFIAELGGADAIVFTGGIGENNPQYRTRAAKNLSFLGCEVDEEANSKRGVDIEITTAESPLKILVLPTDEELMIAEDTYELCK